MAKATRKKRGKEEDNLQNFKYLDTFYLNPQTGQRSKWVRVEQGPTVEEFRNKHGNYNVFATIQLYPNKVKREGGGEEMYAPLFFDIDSSRLLARDCSEDKGKKNKDGLIDLGAFHSTEITALQVSGLLPKELVAHIQNSDMGIPIPDEICTLINAEVDANPDLKKVVWLKNLEQSRLDALKIIMFFTERFGLTEDEVRVYFSGSKGFHILVNPIVLGIKPDKNLHRFFKLIAMYLTTQLGLKSLDTSSIYGHARMLRLVNSIHHKSGLFKVELYHAELKDDLNVIVSTLAKSPREDFYPPEIQELQINSAANEWYLKKVQECIEVIKMEELSAKGSKDEILSKMESAPACVQFIMERGILKSGDRNKATMALAAYHKATGSTQKDTENALVYWVKKIPSSMTSSSASEAIASTISCVKTVYQEDKYRFGCAYIRSLHGDKGGKDYEAVPCGGRNCPAHEDHAIDAEPAEEMHLSQTSKAEFTGKKVSFSALVSGKLDTPYIVPKKVRFLCRNYKYCDKPCVMHEYDGTYDREFHENERFLIEATNQNDNNLKGVLRAHSGASCNKLSYEVLEHINVSELLVVPMADRVKSIEVAKGEFKDVDESGNEYVTRKMYAIGNDIQANSHYQIEGYVYSHPRNAMATILSQKHEPMEDSISSFELTDEVKKSFSVFQVQQGETLDDRISFVINDLVENVTLVHERFQPHLALLMTYHSCLHYFFQGHLEKRGWMETIFVGDSGQAKCANVCSNILTEDGLMTLEDYLPSRVKGDYQPLKSKIQGVNGVESTSHIYVNGDSKTFKIGTNYGFSLESTPNHPIMIMSPEGYPMWKRTDNLCVGDRVFIQRGQNLFGKGEIPEDLGKLLGIIVGDGCSSHKYEVDVTVGTELQANEISALVKKALGVTTSVTTKKITKSKAWKVFWGGRSNREKLSSLGISHATAEFKEVPKAVRMAKRAGVVGFLRGYFETDGHWNSRHGQWEISSKSEKLLEQVQIILLNLGIVSKRYSFNNVVGYEGNIYWKLKVSGKSARLMNTALGYMHEMPEVTNTNFDTIPCMCGFVDDLWKLYKKDHPEVRSRKPIMPKGYSVNTIRQMRYGKHGLSYELLEKLLVLFKPYAFTQGYQVLKEVFDSNFYYDVITSIEESEAFTADFTVPGTHSFFSNGFISHNTMMVSNIMEFCGLGNTASGEGTSRTGLVYRLEQLGERWFITWGKYPLSDRKLIAIDEFSELDPDDFGKITEARTTGVLRVDRTVNTETNARVRLVLLTNPIGTMTLSRYTHGVESLKPLFATPADIRRLDLAVFLQSGDVPKSVLNAEYPAPVNQAVSSEALRNSVLWAWSRKPQDIIIGKPTLKMILKKADELATKYGDAQDVPLMEPADLRKKLARMSIALATLVHSTDPTHEQVIVLPEHVEYVVDFLCIVYDDKNCRLDLYSAKSKEESDLTDEERAQIKKALTDLDFADHALASEELIDLFRRNDVLKPNEIVDMLGFERSQVNTRLAILTKHSMIKRTRDGLRKLPKFIEYLLL